MKNSNIFLQLRQTHEPQWCWQHCSKYQMKWELIQFTPCRALFKSPTLYKHHCHLAQSCSWCSARGSLPSNASILEQFLGTLLRKLIWFKVKHEDLTLSSVCILSIPHINVPVSFPYLMLKPSSSKPFLHFLIEISRYLLEWAGWLYDPTNEAKIRTMLPCGEKSLFVNTVEMSTYQTTPLTVSTLGTNQQQASLNKATTVCSLRTRSPLPLWWVHSHIPVPRALSHT